MRECAGMSPERGRQRERYASSFSNSRAMRQRPSASRRQTIRKRLRTCGASEPFGPRTQFARPCVAAKSPAPRVESATISIEDAGVPHGVSTEVTANYASVRERDSTRPRAVRAVLDA